MRRTRPCRVVSCCLFWSLTACTMNMPPTHTTSTYENETSKRRMQAVLRSLSFLCGRSMCHLDRDEITIRWKDFVSVKSKKAYRLTSLNAHVIYSFCSNYIKARYPNFWYVLTSKDSLTRVNGVYFLKSMFIISRFWEWKNCIPVWTTSSKTMDHSEINKEVTTTLNNTNNSNSSRGKD